MAVNQKKKHYRRPQRRRLKRTVRWLIILALLIIGIYGAYQTEKIKPGSSGISIGDSDFFSGYRQDPVTILDDNKPAFSEEDLTGLTGEHYSDLDDLGRCGKAVVMLDHSMMPTEERGEIGEVRPSGWHTVKYPDIIEDGYLYNRCHLIAYALTGQNENERNLITGTRYMNIEGMLPYEIQVERYLDASENHVLYRVTPVFHENELVARGVEMEAYSVEDRGNGVCFHVFAWNVQPGIVIDYATGESVPDEAFKAREKGDNAA